jgi:hypothetical protein
VLHIHVFRQYALELNLQVLKERTPELNRAQTRTQRDNTHDNKPWSTHEDELDDEKL